MPRPITPATSLDNLRKEAKRWLRALRDGDADARSRLHRALPDPPAGPGLRDVQLALAREHGYSGWRHLTRAVAYHHLAHDWVRAYDARDEQALARLNRHYGRHYSLDDHTAEIWNRVYAFRQRSSRVPKNFLQLEEAQTIVAQDEGYGSWDALLDALETGAPPVPAFEFDAADKQISPRRQLRASEWDALIESARDQGTTTINTVGLATDDALARIASLDRVTRLDLGGSRQLTDAGLQVLARMPQLEHLTLTGTNIGDAGLRVLAQLPRLRTFEMNWSRRITDAGAANLRACDELERVSLMGSTTGDGVIAALEGSARLRDFSSGRLLTDAGLRRLHRLPRFASPPLLVDAAATPDVRVHLLIDGPFTDAGLAALNGLQGVLELDLFWHATKITSQGLAHLRGLPNLTSLGADGKISDDIALAHYATCPRLRFLRIQEAAATDTGFEALSRSQTLEGLWGRECPHFGSRGFLALSRLPALRQLGIGCANVDDAALAALPRFPALRELTPIGVRDDGFRHIGRCERLERLTCMYCRETTDAATAQITRVPLKYYYAGLTQITNRSLELLSYILTLEQVELYECRGVTDAGLPFLARLPRLQEVQLTGLPLVTFAGTQVFPPHVRVRYST